MRILIIGFIIMGQLLFGKPKPKYIPPQNRPGFVSPFTVPPEMKRHNNRQRLEAMAHLIKSSTKTSSSIKEIAAELHMAETRRQK